MASVSSRACRNLRINSSISCLSITSGGQNDIVSPMARRMTPCASARSAQYVTDLICRIECLAGRFVANELDARKQPLAADFADKRMIQKFLQATEEMRLHRAHVLDDVFIFVDPQCFAGDGGGIPGAPNR